MTTELEKDFFKTFEIEPKMLCNCEFKNLYDYRIEYGSDVCDYTESKIKEPCKVCKKAKQKVPLYPEITDRKLLEIICINSYFCGVNFHNLWVKNPDEIKAVILYEIIRWYKEQKYGHEKCKHQIQQLFKEAK